MTKILIVPILKDNYAYILINGEDCAVIDPGEAAPIINTLTELNLKPSIILNTHHHGDHVAGNEELKARYSTHIIAPKGEMHKIPAVDEGLDHGDHIPFGDENFILYKTEGHTASGLMYHLPQSHHLFVGDTLFSMGCGRLFEGTAAQMFDTLKLIKSLPDETLIYCGHEYTLSNAAFALSLFPDNQYMIERRNEAEILRAENKPTLPVFLSAEKRTNPFLMAQTVEQFTKFRKLRDTF